MRVPRIEEAIKIHDDIIRFSGGFGGHEPKKLGLLESALEHAKNDEYYPRLHDKLTHVFFSCVKFHPFLDGNKRSAIAITMQMMAANFVEYKKFVRVAEDLVENVALGTATKDELRSVIKNYITKWGELEQFLLRRSNKS